MKKYIVVLFTESGFPKEFLGRDWPPHVTLLQSFQTELAEGELVARLRAAAARHRPFSIRGKSREMFGPDRDIPVTEVTCPDELHELYEDARGSCGSDVAFATEYPSYRPHVTDQRGAEFPVGATVTLSSLSLVRKEDAGRVVVGTFPLIEPSRR